MYALINFNGHFPKMFHSFYTSLQFTDNNGGKILDQDFLK